MVTSQPPGNNPSYYYRASPPMLLIALNASRDTMFYTCNYNIRVTHRTAYIFFTRIRSTEGSSADCSLFILSLHALALHLAVKILSNLSVWRFEHVGRHTSVGCISLQNASRTALCYATNTIKWKTFLIFDINHQQKHKEVRPDWNDKNDNANLRALVSHGRFYQWLRLPFLKKYLIKCEKI